MSSTPSEAVHKYGSMSSYDHSSYAVFFHYINKDVVTHEDTSKPVGVLVYCGSYSSAEEAENAKIEISLQTGAPIVAMRKAGVPYIIRTIPYENSLVYSSGDDQSIEEIRRSIEHEKERLSKSNEKLQREVEERDDRDSLSFLINRIYRLTANTLRIEKGNEMLQELHKSKERDFNDVVQFLRKHPEAVHQWKTEATSRLEERGEKHILEMMVKGMDDSWKDIERALSRER